MSGADRAKTLRRVRLAAAWAGTALLVAAHFALPESDDTSPLSATPPAGEGQGADARKLDILDVAPPSSTPGSAITITFSAPNDGDGVSVFAGKEPLEVLARRPGAVVARLPADIETGRTKLRIAVGGDRSKPYDHRVKRTNWRKPFRNLVGGFALLLLGIAILSRGVRGAAGFRSAHTLGRLGRRGPAALGLGAVLGAVVQSSTATAGVLAGLVASSLLAIAPAGAAFLGAIVGSVTAPLVTGLIDPREGLLVVAIGVLWMGLASDRRAGALGQLMLGAGLIALGLQTMRPGFELVQQHPTLLGIVSGLTADRFMGIVGCALVGAVLVAILQGPAPVVILVLVLAQTTAQWNFRTALAVLAGAGLGAAIGALLTTPAGRRPRQLAILNLLLGLGSTILASATVPLWTALVDKVIPGAAHEIAWGKRVLMPNIALHLGTAFALSQLASAIVLLPFVPALARLVERRYPQLRRGSVAGTPAGAAGQIGDPEATAKRELVSALGTARRGLTAISELALGGKRDAGQTAEHALSDAHAELEELLASSVPSLTDAGARARLGRLAFAALQVQRALDAVCRQAELFTDGRMAALGGHADVSPLPDTDRATLSGMHDLLAEGLAAVMDAIGGGTPLEMETARAREIRMNGLEARARAALLAGGDRSRNDLGALELVDAYETAGNQLYRLSEAVADEADQIEAALPRSESTG